MLGTTPNLTALSEEFVEVTLRDDPVLATEAGVHDYDARLPDFSPDAIADRIHWLAGFDARLAALDATGYSGAQLVDRDLLRARVAGMRIDLERVRVHAHNPVRAVESAIYGLFLLKVRAFAPLDERKELMLERMVAVPVALERARASLEGVAPPVAALASEVAITGPLFVDDLVRDLRQRFPGEAERIEFAGQRARLGFARFQEEIEKSGDPGVPYAIGEAAINEKLAREHLLDLDCAALAALGREQLEKARADLATEARRIDAAGDWRALVRDGRQLLPDPHRLLEVYASETDRARRFVLENGVAPLPDGALDMIETPLFARSMVPVAAMVPAGPFDDSHGAFYVTPIDFTRPATEQREQLEAHCLPEIPAVVAHEAYPGHHQQFLVANRTESRLRRLGWNHVFCEGWATYSEELMHELGFYTHPLTRLFQLRGQLFRACRVVIDVGLHTGRMGVEEAQRLLVEEAMFSPASAEAEVRYALVNPTQPMSYLVGKLAILSLRDEAQRKLGDRYRAHDFHAALLAGGALPLALVRREIWERLGVV